MQFVTSWEKFDDDKKTSLLYRLVSVDIINSELFHLQFLVSIESVNWSNTLI